MDVRTGPMLFAWPMIGVASVVCSAGALGVCRAWPNWPAAFVMAFVTTMFAASALHRRYELAERGITQGPVPRWRVPAITGLIIVLFTLGLDRIFGKPKSDLPFLLMGTAIAVITSALSKSWADRPVDPKDEVQVTSAESPRAKSAR